MAEQTTIPATWLRDGVPDWSAIDREIACPRCGYDLRGLAEPRCPECGLEFAWGDALSTPFTVSPWLFEHQWRRRPIWSFVQSSLAACNPPRFWARLPLQLRVDCSGLALQLLISLAICWAAYVSALAAAPIALAVWRDYQPIAIRPGWPGSMQSSLIGTFGSFWKAPSYWWINHFVVLAAILFVASNLLVLLTLRQTLARFRIRNAQLVRVVACCAVPWLVASWLAALVLTVDELFTFAVACGFIPWGGISAVFARWLRDELPLLAAIPIWWFSLSCALQRYLRLPRAGLIAGLSTIAASLMIGIGPLVWHTYIRLTF